MVPICAIAATVWIRGFPVSWSAPVVASSVPASACLLWTGNFCACCGHCTNGDPGEAPLHAVSLGGTSLFMVLGHLCFMMAQMDLVLQSMSQKWKCHINSQLRNACLLNIAKQTLVKVAVTFHSSALYTSEDKNIGRVQCFQFKPKKEKKIKAGRFILPNSVLSERSQFVQLVGARVTELLECSRPFLRTHRDARGWVSRIVNYLEKG